MSLKNETRELNSILCSIKNLSEAEQAKLAEQILAMLSEPNKTKKTVSFELTDVAADSKPDCPHCQAKANMGWVVKHGTDKGRQRYYCKSCGKHFFSTTNTVFAHTRKDADTWRKFIRLTIAGESLHTCCSECNIAHQTAFTWRHKVLNAFVTNQNNVTMNGVVEVDEMLLPISYKGNHIKGSFCNRKKANGVDDGMPRKAFKRGSDNKSSSSKDKACVFCMVEDGNKAFYASVPGVGFMSKSMLDKTVGKHINKETALMLADKYAITERYFEENGYNHKTLLSNTSENPREHKPEIEGDIHLQHVNSMHSHIRRFLAKYYGVSSKYLENYVALYTWMKSVAKTKKRNHSEKASIARTATSDCYITRKAIEARPAVPQCA